MLSNSSHFDIIIIGGGATGLGCAVDAASRGYKTLLLEKYDFAKGTSSRATKLVHGGVRYLEQGNIRLVREALLERGRLLRNAPHVCHTLAFVVPFYNWWQKLFYGVGLWWYEYLSAKLSLGKTKSLTKNQALNLVPNLAEEKLKGGILYFDGQFDDSRLAINLAQTAIEQGATVLNYCCVNGFLKDNTKIVGVKAIDELNGTTLEFTAAAIINATGVFADSVLRMAEGYKEETISPSQGIHLVIDKKFFPGDTALMIPKTDDGRVLFVIPWHNKLLLGTTDTPIEQITTEPHPLQPEIDFIIKHFNRYSTSTLTRTDVMSVFVGLRPLAKTKTKGNTSVMPRDHQIKVLPSGLIHVTGGKWTTYRSMAEHAVNVAAHTANLKRTICKTKILRIHGWTLNKLDSHLTCYGSDAIEIQKLIDTDDAMAEKLHPNHPYTWAEVRWSIENEMAMTVEDVLTRRIRLLFLDARAAIEVAPKVALNLVAWGKISKAESQWQLIDFVDLAKGYLIQ
jgi:glycerol-3-phosphate dehydrogenase